MKVLVTGTGSMLLRGIANELIKRGDEVVCLQRRPVDSGVSQNARHVSADIRDVEAVTSAASDCDAIIHGAARVGIVGKWHEFQTTNVGGTENVIHAAKKQNVSRLVFVSTPSVAHTGHSIIGASAEPAQIGRKNSFYAESKAIAERTALGANSDDLAVVAIRPHLVWGPGDTQLIGRIVERAASGRLAIVGNGHALVDTTYVDNAVSGHIAALDALHIGESCAGKAYVLSNGEPRTVNELMRSICGAAGVPFTPRHIPLATGVLLGSVVERLWPLVQSSEPPITRFIAEQLGTAHWFDQRSFQNDCSWTPQVSLDEGFSRLAQWFAAQ
jgi:nucleoside-diphosphate-sugar epimerase